MTDLINFEAFPKIPRYDKEQYIVITEKIDGTNAQIVINEDCTELRAGSRNRWVSVDDDNYGFARWCNDNKEKLLTLGKGRHYGEWWGYGINRCYNLKEKRFSLFNTLRWEIEEQLEKLDKADVHLVPILYKGPFKADIIEDTLKTLEKEGSKASEGFQNPEGIVIYFPAWKTIYKKTIGSDKHKYEES